MSLGGVATASRREHRPYRYYQQAADEALMNVFVAAATDTASADVTQRALVKMFCGTGKSLLMRQATVLRNQPLVVYVFPTLHLVDQFCSDYLFDVAATSVLRVSSDLHSDSTTNPEDIRQFLRNQDKEDVADVVSQKIVCVTYQSYNTLLTVFEEEDRYIDVCVYDEAHHAVGAVSQTLIFRPPCRTETRCRRQVFFTATPKNANGVVMYDRHGDPDKNQCGVLAFEYTYLQALADGFVKPFEIRLDLFMENDNRCIYEAIARAVLTTGNNRVLTFHADVHGDRNKSVHQFVNREAFTAAFHHVVETEFPHLRGHYQQEIIMKGLDATMSIPTRVEWLRHFDRTPDDQIFILASCETIGEGIDTKRANMCVFADPKSSYVKIIQNIGRIVRRVEGEDTPPSTVLLPCWVDRAKYEACGGDREKCDTVLREDMGETGNFNGILNVLSALRQEDEDLYEICLYYPRSYAPRELQENLRTQGYQVLETVGEGGLFETLDDMLEGELDEFDEMEEDETEEEWLQRVAENHNLCVEVHTNSLENPVERYNFSTGSEASSSSASSASEEEKEQDDTEGEDDDEEVEVESVPEKRTIRLLKTIPKRQLHSSTPSEDNDGDGTDDESCSADGDEEKEVVYQQVVPLDEISGKKNRKKVESGVGKQLRAPATRGKRLHVVSHNHPDVQVLWKIEGQLVNKLRSAVIDCEVVDTWQQKHDGVVAFVEKNGKLPSRHSKDDTEKKLGHWVSDQKINFKRNKGAMADPDKCSLWQAFMEKYPNLFANFDDRWRQTFENVRAFVVQHGKLPSQFSKDPVKKKWGKWIVNQNVNFKQNKEAMSDPDKRSLWQAFMKKYPTLFANFDARWTQSLADVRTFVVQYGKLPFRHAKDPVEKKWARWIDTQKGNFKQNKDAMSDPDKHDQWQAFTEEYPALFADFDDRWTQYLADVRTFVIQHGNLPSQHAKDPAEKKWARWITVQKRNFKQNKQAMVDPDKRDQWQAFIEEFPALLDLDERWHQTLAEVHRFVVQHGKLPSQCSKDPVEKKLVGWITVQKRKKKQSMADPDKRNQWQAFVETHPVLFADFDDRWCQTFENVRTFVVQRGKLPNSKAKDPVEKKWGKWINKQKVNFKQNKEAMADPDKRNQWQVFTEQFPALFASPSSRIRPTSNSTAKSATLQRQKLDKRKATDQSTNDNHNEDEPPETPQAKRQRTKSQLTDFHRRYLTMRSDTLGDHFRRNRAEFDEYHRVREENLQQFRLEDQTHYRIIQELDKLRTKPGDVKTVVDMGCGLAKIARHFQEAKNDPRFTFLNYDHVAFDPRWVTECDIAHLPLADHSVDICILSFALWGSNCKDYLKEAHRVLETHGTLYVIDSTKRWTEGEYIHEGKEADKLIPLLHDAGFRIVEQHIDKFCMFVCVGTRV